MYNILQKFLKMEQITTILVISSFSGAISCQENLFKHWLHTADQYPDAVSQLQSSQLAYRPDKIALVKIKENGPIIFVLFLYSYNLFFTLLATFSTVNFSPVPVAESITALWTHH